MSRTVTITGGKPNRQGDEKDFTGPDGTYPVVLIAISDEVTQKSTAATAKSDTWTYRVWTIAIDSGPHMGEVMDIRASSSSTGPKSKQYGLIAAFAGRTPPEGTDVNLDKLIGRQALAAIATNENDYPYVDKVMAMPPGMLQAPEPTATKPAAAPPPEPVAATTDSDLPF